MARVVLAPAAAGDDAELRRLLADNPMDGRIRIAFEREPSYFHAVEVQGGFAQVLVGRDLDTGALVGVGTRAVKPAFVNGEPRQVGYLSELRLLPPYRNRTLVARGYRLLRELHRDGRADLYYTVIAADNMRALRTIASGRAGLPAYRDLGIFHSPAVNLVRRLPPLQAGVEIVRGEPALLDDIVACLNEHGRAKQFAPVYGRDDFGPAGWLRDFRVRDFYLALDRGRAVGTLARWDQSRFKQTRVVGYRGSLRLLRPLCNVGARLFGLPRFPRPGEHLASFYAGFIAIAGNDVRIFGALLRRLYNDAIGGPHAYFVIGLHERDPLRAALADYRCSPYRGRLFCAHFEDGEAAYRALDDRTPHVELATL
ncbi:MAG: hypothetical protein ACREM3_02650 [Candidatus Rokuibacteriota bacterium]